MIKPLIIAHPSARDDATRDHNQRQLRQAIAAIRGRKIPAPMVREPAFDRSNRKGD
jgi:hypothetical protein